MEEEYKKYAIFENILQYVNQKCIALPPDERKRNSQLLQVVDRIIQSLQNKSILFKSLYQNKFYGGSYYDGLKVGKPSEYDLDCLLSLPKIAEPKVEVSDIPGYVHVVLKNRKALEKKLDEAPKYVGLEKLLEGDYLSTKKVKAWMESLVASVVGDPPSYDIMIDDKKCVVKCRFKKTGPALTFILEGEHDGKEFNLNVDLVPSFTFFDDQWPKEGYRANPSKSRNTFFVVPKSPSDDQTLCWRLSFQEQERELLNGCSVIKPTIRLIKKVRDRHQHFKIASYFIKTIFLWELNETKDLHNGSLSSVFVMMLKKYSTYLENRSIPYYWNADYNLIGDLPDKVVIPIANKIKKIIQDIDNICNLKSDFYGIADCLISLDENEQAQLKREVLLPKRIKQADSKKTREIRDTSGVPTCDETDRNVFSQDLYSLLESVALDQKRIYELLDKLFEKVAICEEQIRDLRTVIDNDRLENTIERGETLKLIHHFEGKVDDVDKTEIQLNVDSALIL